jgi:hypothetical protein
MKRALIIIACFVCLAPILAQAQVCVEGRHIRTVDPSEPCRGDIVFSPQYTYSAEERAAIARAEEERRKNAERLAQQLAKEQAQRDRTHEREMLVHERRMQGESESSARRSVARLKDKEVRQSREYNLERNTGVRRKQ